MTIVFLDAYTLDADGLDISGLSELGNLSRYDRSSREETIARSQDAEIVITNKTVIDKELIDQLPMLKYIVVAATGYNVVDVNYAADRGIPVSNVSGYSTEGVVQHTFSLILALLNQVSRYNEEVNSGSWQECPDFSYYRTIHELAGKTMGIIGYGTIGARVAEVASAFRMKVIAHHYEPERKWFQQVDFLPLKEVFQQSDFLSLHVPLSATTSRLINKTSLASMKNNAYLINTGRGGLVDESALDEALQKGEIAGAALDVLSTEPPVENPLILNDKCIITPHMAWASRESREKLRDGIINNIKSYQLNKIINQVN